MYLVSVSIFLGISCWIVLICFIVLFPIYFVCIENIDCTLYLFLIFIFIPFSTKPISQLVLELLLQKKFKYADSLILSLYYFYFMLTPSKIYFFKISLMTFSTTFHWRCAEKVNCKVNWVFLPTASEIKLFNFWELIIKKKKKS